MQLGIVLALGYAVVLVLVQKNQTLVLLPNKNKVVEYLYDD